MSVHLDSSNSASARPNRYGIYLGMVQRKGPPRPVSYDITISLPPSACIILIGFGVTQSKVDMLIVKHISFLVGTRHLFETFVAEMTDVND